MITRRRKARIELRTTPAVRELIDRAVKASGCTLTEFAEASLTAAAQRILADSWDAWFDEAGVSDDFMTQRDQPAVGQPRELPGVRRLIERPSPFAE